VSQLSGDLVLIKRCCFLFQD